MKPEIVIMETNVFSTAVILLKDVNTKMYQSMTKMLVPMTVVPQMQELPILQLSAMISRNVLMTLVIKQPAASLPLFLVMIKINVLMTLVSLALDVLITQ